MAGTDSTCLSSRVEKRQAVLDAGQRIAQLMASLPSDLDREALRTCITQVQAALESLTPMERLSALDCAAAEQEVAP